jgi:TRAP-type C4-dicarboxylate transport system substrate-binding protein
MGNISQMAADDPRFEGLDLAGVTLENAEARRIVDAYKPIVARIMKEKFNAKLLGLSQNPAQVLWCRTPVKGLADIKGKKVRVVNPTMNDFITGAGGTPVTMPFIEVIPALQRGVAECAVTGAINGYTAKWQEVTTHFYPMNFGWGIVFWNKLDPRVQSFLEEQFKKARFSFRPWPRSTPMRTLERPSASARTAWKRTSRFSTRGSSRWRKLTGRECRSSSGQI